MGQQADPDPGGPRGTAPDLKNPRYVAGSEYLKTL